MLATDHTRLMTDIAKRSAARDLQQAREIITRLRHDWKGVSQVLDGQSFALANQLDEFEVSIRSFTPRGAV